MDNVLFAVLSTLMELLPVAGILVRNLLVTNLQTWDYVENLLALSVAQCISFFILVVLLSDRTIVLLDLEEVVVKFLLADTLKVEL